MGFFQELKEDLSQAVNELVPDEELENVSAADVKEEEENTADFTEAVEEKAIVTEPEESIVAENTEKAVQPKEEIKDDGFKSVSDEVSTITARMKVIGDIESDGSLDLVGSVTGNITILGKLNVTGNINGNAEAAEVYAQDAKITGDVTSLGSVKIGNNSVIRGNIYATSAVIAGAVKGDIDVKGPVILDASAIVMGNIKSKAVQINNGAVIEGLCSQCYAEVNPSSFFKD